MWIFALKPSCVIVISVYLIIVAAGSLTQLSLQHALEIEIKVWPDKDCKSGAEIRSKNFADIQQKEIGCSHIHSIKVSLL